MEDLPAKVFSATPEPAIVVLGNKGASEIAPSVPSAEEVRNCQVRVADARHAAAAHGAQEALDEPTAAGNEEASVGKLCGTRGKHVHGVGHEASPVTEFTHDRLDDSSTVQRKLSEALPAPISLVSESMLMDVDQEHRPESPESTLVLKDPAAGSPATVEPTKTPKDERGHYTLEFMREVVEYALRLPVAARITPTARAYSLGYRTVSRWLRDAESGAAPRPRFTHSCKQCPRTGPCKEGAGCNAGSGRASEQCEHGHQRHACRRGLCPARQLNAKAGYGYNTDDEIAAVLDRGPNTRLHGANGHRRGSWPMGRPTGAALHRVMKRAAGSRSRMHAPSSLGR